MAEPRIIRCCVCKKELLDTSVEVDGKSYCLSCSEVAIADVLGMILDQTTDPEASND